ERDQAGPAAPIIEYLDNTGIRRVASLAPERRKKRLFHARVRSARSRVREHLSRTRDEVAPKLLTYGVSAVDEWPSTVAPGGRGSPAAAQRLPEEQPGAAERPASCASQC